jgi:hypothetical protein
LGKRQEYQIGVEVEEEEEEKKDNVERKLGS